MDFSTLDIDRLKNRGIYTPPASLKVSDSMGNGCAGDPPGYPTYYTRCIYTMSGNTPNDRYKAPEYVIVLEGVAYIAVPHNVYDEKREQYLHRLWKPLPIDHPRTRLWIVSTYQHFNYCYADVEKPEYGRPGTLIYPVPYYELKTPHIDPHWTEEYKATVNAEAEAFNKMVRDRAEKIAIPENHKGYQIVKRFYPDHQPDLDLINNPGNYPRPGQWWETEAEQPTEENCAKSQRWGYRHPFNGTWCQWCGRSYKEQATA